MGFSGGSSSNPATSATVDLTIGWNTSLLTALAASGTSLARLAVIADSLGSGAFASNLRTKSWVGLLQTQLQASYGDGGSGFVSPGQSDTWLTSQAVPAGTVTTYKGNGSIATTTGVWGSNTAVAMAGIALTTVDVAATYIDVVRGSTVKVYFLGNAGGNASASVQVDGGAIVPVLDTAVGLQPYVYTLSGLSTGTHTVKVSYTDAGVKTLFYAGMEGFNPTGFTVDNFSVYGIKAAQMARQTNPYADVPPSLEPDWMGGFRHPASAAIIALGANDATTSTAADTYALNMRQIMTRLRDGSQNTNKVIAINALANPNISILIVMDHIGAFDGASATTPVWQDYCIRMDALRKAFGASLVNLWADGQASWNAYKRLGFWGDNTNPGVAGNDPIHLSDAGHAQRYAKVINPVVTTV